MADRVNQKGGTSLPQRSVAAYLEAPSPAYLAGSSLGLVLAIFFIAALEAL